MVKNFVSQGAKIGAIAGAISSGAFTLACIILFLAIGRDVLVGVSLVDFLSGLIYILVYSLFPIVIAVIIGSFTGAVFGFVLGKFRPAKMNYAKICGVICFLICIVMCALLALSMLGTFSNPIAMNDGHVLMSLEITAVIYLVLCGVYVFVGFLVSRYLYNHLQVATDANSSSN